MKFLDQYKGLRRELYILCFCRLIDNLGSMIGPMLTLILSSKMGMNAKEIAIFTATYTILSLPVDLFGGRLTDKINKKLLINICDISTSIIYIACGLLGLNGYTLLLYLFGSLLQSAEYPAYNSLLADFTTSEDRDRGYSFEYLCTNFGLILAPTVGGFLLKDHVKLLFIINGISQFISIILFDIFVKDMNAVYDGKNIYEQQTNLDSTLKVLRNNKILIAIVVIFAIGGFVYNMFAYLMPLSLDSIHGDNGSIYYGTISTCNCITVLLCTAYITSLFSKITSINKMIIAEILQMIGFALFFVFIDVTFVYYIATIIFTFGEILNTIASSPYLTKRIPINYRGRILSMSDVAYKIVSSIGSIIIGFIYDEMGINYAWTIVIVIGIIIVIAFEAIKKKDKETYPELYKENIA